MIWVIGDIHGMYDPLKSIVNIIRQGHYSGREQVSKIIFLGDYIDYGESSKEVIDLLIELSDEFEVVFLAGNHEDLLLQYVHGSDLFERYGNIWFKDNGAQETLISLSPLKEKYMDIINTKARNDQDITWENLKIDVKYLQFFQKLKYCHYEEIGNEDGIYKFVFTHAGLNMQEDIDKQLEIKNYEDYHKYRKENKEWIEDSLIWSRKIPKNKVGKYILINGHTPTFGIDRYYQNNGNFKVDSNMPYLNFESEKAMCYKSGYQTYCFEGGKMENLISINIDTGAVFGKYLTAIKIPQDIIYTGIFDVLQIATFGSRKDWDSKKEYRFKLSLL